MEQSVVESQGTRILLQTGASGISRVLRLAALGFGVVLILFLPWALANYWDDLSYGERIRVGLGLLVYIYCVLNLLFYYVRFTEQGIERRSSFGKKTFYRYEDVEGFEVSQRNIRIDLRGGKKLKIKRLQADWDKVVKILKGRGLLQTD